MLNPTDIKTYPLFGDGAGAVFVERGRPDQGFLSYSMGSEGWGGPLLQRAGLRHTNLGENLPEAKTKEYKVSHWAIPWTAKYYGDSTRWRAIAQANGVVDPLALRTGSLLSIPRSTQ